MVYSINNDEFRDWVKKLVDNLPEQGKAGYGEPSELVKYNTGLINDKVQVCPAVLDMQLSEGGLSLRDYAAARGYSFAEKGIVPTPAPMQAADAPVAETSSTAFSELFQRKMQRHATEQAGFVAKQPDGAGQSHAIKHIMLAEGGGPVVKLKKKLERTGGHSFGSGSSVSNLDAGLPETRGYNALAEMLAAKIKARTGENAQYSPEDIVTMLLADDYIERGPSPGVHVNLKTTEKAARDGVLAVIKGLPLAAVANPGNFKIVTFTKSNLIDALEKRPNAFLSIYQRSSDLPPAKVVTRLKSMGHLEKSSFTETVPPAKPGETPVVIEYYKTSSKMDRLLTDLGVAVGHDKKQGTPVVAVKRIDAMLESNKRVFEPLLNDLMRLTTEEVVTGLKERGWIQKVVTRDRDEHGRPVDRFELQAMNDETTHILRTALPVPVRVDERGYDRHIDDKSLLEAFDGDSQARDRALKGITLRDRSKKMER